MATLLAVAVAILVVGTVLGLLRHSRRRIHDLETELDQVYEAQHIVDRARARKNRRHLHLLAVVPLAWLASRLHSSTGRLAAATAASTMVAGASFVATDSHPPKQLTPPAAAETTVPPTRPGGIPPIYTYPPHTPTTTSSLPVAAEPPFPAAASPGPVPATAPAEVPAPEPTPTTTTSSTTTTTLLVVPEVCVNPQGIPLPGHVCLG